MINLFSESCKALKWFKKYILISLFYIKVKHINNNHVHPNEIAMRLLLTLSQNAPLFCEFISDVCGCFFLLNLFIIIGLCLYPYFSNHNPFLREHISVCFIEFPSLMCWCTVIHHHQSQGLLFFKEWDRILHVCSVMCAQTSCLKSHPRRLGYL